MRKSNHKRKGGLDFPELMTAKEFAAYLGRRSVKWIKEACKRGQILACQKVGGDWVIAKDTLIRPRHLQGMPNELIDMDLPIEFLLPGEPMEIQKPVYKPHPKDLHKVGHNRKVKLPSLRRIRIEKGMSQYDLYEESGVSRDTQRFAEKGLDVLPTTALRLAYGLDVEVEDLLRYER